MKNEEKRHHLAHSIKTKYRGFTFHTMNHLFDLTCTCVGFLCVPGEGGEKDINHGEDQEKCGPGGLPFQVLDLTFKIYHSRSLIPTSYISP